MKRATSVDYLILEVLDKQLDDIDRFLSLGELAFCCNGLCYEKGERRNKPITAKTVRIALPRVRAIALQNGFVIIAQRAKHKYKDSKSNKVVGLKIALEEDRDYTFDDRVESKTIKSRHQSNNKIVVKIIKRNNLLSPEQIKYLENNEDT